MCLLSYLVGILFLCRHSAANVALAFIDVEYLSDLSVQRRVQRLKPSRNVLMYRAFAYSEAMCRLPHRSALLGNKAAQHLCALFNRICHLRPPCVLIIQYICGETHDYAEPKTPLPARGQGCLKLIYNTVKYHIQPDIAE